MTRVLVLDHNAEDYLPSLQRSFPDLQIDGSRPGEELPANPAAIEVLIAFGLCINDDLLRSMTAIKWIHSLATGVDYFLRLPSLSTRVLLTSGRGIHGPAHAGDGAVSHAGHEPKGDEHCFPVGHTTSGQSERTSSRP